MENQIHFRITADEKNKIKEIALKHGFTNLSEFLKACIYFYDSEKSKQKNDENMI